MTSTSAKSKALSKVRSLTTHCKKPPKVMVEPTATLGPSAPHLFFELESAKCPCIGNGETA